jgi:hypothetical protein
VKLDRRGFLSFLGVGTVAGPGAVKGAAAMTLADTKLRSLGLASGHAGVLDEPQAARSRAEWARQQLKQLAGFTPDQQEMRRRQFYLEGIEADVAPLRSVALAHKIRMSREIAWRRSEKTQRAYLNGLIKGWWD